MLCFELYPARLQPQKVIEFLESGLQALADDTPEAGGQGVFVPGEEGKSGVP
jgi:hypothetical protein